MHHIRYSVSYFHTNFYSTLVNVICQNLSLGIAFFLHLTNHESVCEQNNHNQVPGTLNSVHRISP